MAVTDYGPTAPCGLCPSEQTYGTIGGIDLCRTHFDVVRQIQATNHEGEQRRHPIVRRPLT